MPKLLPTPRPFPGSPYPRGTPPPRLAPLAAALIAAAAQAGALAAQEPDYPETPHLADGPWLGTGILEGPIRMEFPMPDGKGTLTFQYRLEGVFHLQVEDGSVTGEVLLDGTSEMVGGAMGLPGAQASGPIGGSGTAEGTAYRFSFLGSTEGDQQGRTASGIPVSGSGDMPLEIEVTITEATCTDARGEWTQDWKTLFREGFEKEVGEGVYVDDLRGEFVATRQDEAVQQALEEYFERASPLVREGGGEVPRLEQEPEEVGEVPPAVKELVEGFARLVSDYNAQIVDEWDPASPHGREQAFGLTGRAVDLLEALREERCTAELIGEEHLERLRRGLAALYRNSALRILESVETHDDRLTGHNIEGLVRRGEALDAFAPGPDAPEGAAGRAAQLDEGLRRAAERVLEEHPVPHRMGVEEENPPAYDPDLGADEVQAALRAAAARGWTLEAFGRSYDAAELVEGGGGAP